MFNFLNKKFSRFGAFMQAKKLMSYRLYIAEIAIYLVPLFVFGMLFLFDLFGDPENPRALEPEFYDHYINIFIYSYCGSFIFFRILDILGLFEFLMALRKYHFAFYYKSNEYFILHDKGFLCSESFDSSYKSNFELIRSIQYTRSTRNLKMIVEEMEYDTTYEHGRRRYKNKKKLFSVYIKIPDHVDVEKFLFKFTELSRIQIDYI